MHPHEELPIETQTTEEPPRIFDDLVLGIEPDKPTIRNYFKIDGLNQYEFGIYEISAVVTELIHNGAVNIAIRRYVVDDNEKPQSLEQTPSQEVLVRGVVIPSDS